MSEHERIKAEIDDCLKKSKALQKEINKAFSAAKKAIKEQEKAGDNNE